MVNSSRLLTEDPSPEVSFVMLSRKGTHNRTIHPANLHPTLKTQAQQVELSLQEYIGWSSLPQQTHELNEGQGNGG